MLWALLLIKETCQLCFPSWAWWDEAGGRTLMRKCGTTSTSRGWLPGARPKTVHTYKKKRGWESIFWYANLSIMWDFAALDSGSCGRVWRNGSIRVYKDRLQMYMPLFWMLSVFKIKILIINILLPQICVTYFVASIKHQRHTSGYIIALFCSGKRTASVEKKSHISI